MIDPMIPYMNAARTAIIGPADAYCNDQTAFETWVQIQVKKGVNWINVEQPAHRSTARDDEYWTYATPECVNDRRFPHRVRARMHWEGDFGVWHWTPSSTGWEYGPDIYVDCR